MNFIPIKTRVFRLPQDDIYKLLDESATDLCDGDLLCVTSKILAIAQGRCIKIGESVNKHAITKKEADWFHPQTVKAGRREVMLTIKDHTLIPSAGIDESNGNGYYVLWPRHTNRLLREIWLYLKKKHGLRRLGLIATDSHTIPLRRGVVGISTGFWGFTPLLDRRGSKDIFGRKLKMTRSNIVDAVAAAAVLVMGEGREKIPFVICRGMGKVHFNSQDNYRGFIIDKKSDLYRPILKGFKRA